MPQPGVVDEHGIASKAAPKESKSDFKARMADPYRRIKDLAMKVKK
jgi:hypothetical protein